jgi:TPR repeat protein
MAETILSTLGFPVLQLLKSEDFNIGTPLSLEEATKYYGIRHYTPEEVEEIYIRTRTGDADAHHQLALRYFYGLGGISVNRREAFFCNALAAESGHRNASFNVAIQLFIVGYKHDDEQLISIAVRLFAASAHQGFAPAKYCLWRIDQNKRTYPYFYPSDSTLESRYQLLQEAAEEHYRPAVRDLKTALTPEEQKLQMMSPQGARPRKLVKLAPKAL